MDVVHMIEQEDFWDELGEVEESELQAKNYVEFLRIYCSRVKHHSNSMHCKAYYRSLREDLQREVIEKRTIISLTMHLDEYRENVGKR